MYSRIPTSTRRTWSAAPLAIFLFLGFTLTACSSTAEVEVSDWGAGTSSLMLDDFTQEEFDDIRDSGMQYLELYMGSQRNKSDSAVTAWVRDIKSKADSAGIVVRSVHLPFSRTMDVSTLNDSDRTTTVEEHKRLMALLEPLNIKVYVIHGSFEPIADEERDERLANLIESLKILTDAVKQYDAELAIEILPRTCLGNTSEEILWIVNEVNNGLRICFDSNHELQESPVDFVRSVGNLIATVHMSDYDGVDEKHWIPGRGINDWNGIIAALDSVGYEGPWMYEVVRRKSDDPQVTRRDLGENWMSLRKAFLESESGQ